MEKPHLNILDIHKQEKNNFWNESELSLNTLRNKHLMLLWRTRKILLIWHKSKEFFRSMIKVDMVFTFLFFSKFFERRNKKFFVFAVFQFFGKELKCLLKWVREMWILWKNIDQNKKHLSVYCTEENKFANKFSILHF